MTKKQQKESIYTKLRKIELQGIKNVKHGSIDFFSKKKGYLNTVAIYGQNGSGKTSVISSMKVFRSLILRGNINDGMNDLLLKGSTSCIKLFFDAYQEGKDEYTTISYFVKFKKDSDGDVRISEESISSGTNGGRLWERLAYDENTKYSMLTNQFTNEGVLKVAEKTAIEQKNSLFFNMPYISYLDDLEPKKYQMIKETIAYIINFARNLVVFDNTLTNIMMNDRFIPLGIENKFGGYVMPVLISDNQEFFDIEDFENLEKTIRHINKVLPYIVPELTISIKERKRRLKADGSGEELNFEMFSNRDGVVIPFRAESDGIKKIVSILIQLIEVFNNKGRIICIDELDSGIFEYLLGEIVKVLSENSKGQLIFTSHNLRVLEVLDVKNIVFTTTNPKNRYTVLKNIKKTNNVRDVYMRALQVGDESEELLYQETDASSIRRAFRKAGRNND